MPDFPIELGRQSVDKVNAKLQVLVGLNFAAADAIAPGAGVITNAAYDLIGIETASGDPNEDLIKRIEQSMEDFRDHVLDTINDINACTDIKIQQAIGELKSRTFS